MERFAGQRAVVTGAGAGIGREVALGLAQGGAASVTLVDVDESSLESLCREISSMGCEALKIVGDVGEEEVWSRVTHVANGTNFDIVVNNAGMAQVKSVEDVTLHEWQRVIDVNLSSVFLSAKYLLPLLRDGGAMVNVASVAALVGQSTTPSYIASKGGVVALTRGLAVDYAHRRLRVNAVCPGPTNSSLLHRHFESLGDANLIRKQLERRIPLGRLLEPDDVKPLVLFLASEEATMISGATFVVDGGLSATFDYGEGLTQSEAATQ